MIIHIVLFKLRDQSPANVAQTRGVLLSMIDKVPQLRHLEVGEDLIHSERSYDLALVTKFDSLDDLRAYQIHPYHAGQVLPHTQKVSSSVVTVDYESK